MGGHVIEEIALNLDDGTSTESLAWAMVERAPERERYRLFGLGYECRLWMPDQHKPEVSCFEANYTPFFNYYIHILIFWN